MVWVNIFWKMGAKCRRITSDITWMYGETVAWLFTLQPWACHHWHTQPRVGLYSPSYSDVGTNPSFQHQVHFSFGNTLVFQCIHSLFLGSFSNKELNLPGLNASTLYNFIMVSSLLSDEYLLHKEHFCFHSSFTCWILVGNVTFAGNSEYVKTDLALAG